MCALLRDVLGEDSAYLYFIPRFILKSNYLNVIVIILVLLDSLCVTIELIIDLENSQKSDGLKIAADFFKYLGLIIISTFVVEISLKIVFLWREFFKSKLDIIDGIIVYVSFTLDIVFMYNDEISALGIKHRHFYISFFKIQYLKFFNLHKFSYFKWE